MMESEQILEEQYISEDQVEQEEEEEYNNNNYFYDKDRWDEGGLSDCGFSILCHETLMSIGGCMHHIFGEPSENMSRNMKGVGNYVQEASYAVRDFRRGTLQKDEFRFKTDDLELDEEEEEAVMSAASAEEGREEEQQHWMLRLDSKSPYGLKTVPMLS
jgi:hypothetical protein